MKLKALCKVWDAQFIALSLIKIMISITKAIQQQKQVFACA